MGKPDFPTYLRSLETTLTLVVLTASFIFTALTLVLLEIGDEISVWAQAALLVLIIAFGLSWFCMIFINMRIRLLGTLTSEAKPPDTPGWRFYNPLYLLTILLMTSSICFMLFWRGLIYLGLTSAALLVSWFVVFYIYILRVREWRTREAQN